MRALDRQVRARSARGLRVSRGRCQLGAACASAPIARRLTPTCWRAPLPACARPLLCPRFACRRVSRPQARVLRLHSHGDGRGLLPPHDRRLPGLVQRPIRAPSGEPEATLVLPPRLVVDAGHPHLGRAARAQALVCGPQRGADSLRVAFGRDFCRPGVLMRTQALWRARTRRARTKTLPRSEDE